MTVISIKIHKRILREVKQRTRLYLIISIIGAFLFGALITPLQIGSLTETYKSYQRVKILRVKLLENILRDKTLTVGEAITITDTLIDKTSADVPLHVVLGIIDVESQFTINCQSKKGCRGLMQLSPIVWKIYMGDTAFKDFKNAYSPCLNISVGIQYLGDLHRTFSGDWGKILKQYHSGDSELKSSSWYVAEVLKIAKGYRVTLN